MGISDLPIWGRLAGMFLDEGMDRMGAKKCATKGHVWRDVGAVELLEGGGMRELPKGARQRCRRCGAVRDPQNPGEPVLPTGG